MTRLQTADWQSGDRAWLVELVAPAALAGALLEELGRTVFGGRPFGSHAGKLLPHGFGFGERNGGVA